ncbi:hypothetical protein [Singulisphaera sp. PoT]|uniref:hypothetical protein n=1 Tax=Singulisphaera sp. PoT TaxID=3411797 RepID=UPI003BF6014F
MSTMQILGTLVVVSAVVYAVLGAWVAVQNGRGKIEGSILGLLLGPFGVLVEALLPSRDYHEMPRRPHALSDSDLARRFPAIAERMGRRTWN